MDSGEIESFVYFLLLTAGLYVIGMVLAHFFNKPKE